MIVAHPQADQSRICIRNDPSDSPTSAGSTAPEFADTYPFHCCKLTFSLLQIAGSIPCIPADLLPIPLVLSCITVPLQSGRISAVTTGSGWSWHNLENIQACDGRENIPEDFDHMCIVVDCRAGVSSPPTVSCMLPAR